MSHFMADEPAALPTADAPLAPAAAPVVEPAPAIAPEAPAPVADTPVAEPVVDAPAAEVPAVEPVVETPAETPAPDAPAVDPAVEAAAVEPAAPVYTDFKVPDGMALPAERLAEFTGVLGKYGLTQEAGQELLDLHAATASRLQTDMDQRQRDAFEDTRRGFREDFYKSAGNRADTMANDAKWAIQQLVKNTDQRKELFTVLDYTGAGDHKAVVGLLAAAAKVMRERGAPAHAAPPKGTPSNPWDARYGPRA